MRESSIDLSEGQKSCLRLVAQGMSSKEIARVTGFTPQTVDTYLKAALGRLDVPNRREAARLLVAWELSQKLGSPLPALAQPARPVEDRQRSNWSAFRRMLRLPPLGGGTNDLSWAEKTYEAMRVAAAGAAIVIALALAIAGLFQTVR